MEVANGDLYYSAQYTGSQVLNALEACVQIRVKIESITCQNLNAICRKKSKNFLRGVPIQHSKDVKETQPLVFQPLTSPFDFLTVENEIVSQKIRKIKCFLDISLNSSLRAIDNLRILWYTIYQSNDVFVASTR